MVPGSCELLESAGNDWDQTKKHWEIHQIPAGRVLWVTSRENYLSWLSHPTAALNKMRWCVGDSPSESVLWPKSRLREAP